jgi:hypothetical protein
MRPSHIAAILDREFLAAASGQHTPVMLWGPPGVGKSQIVAQIAQRHAVPLLDLRLSQMEPTDLRGIPFRQGDRVEWSVPSMLPDASRHGPRGILFLDEINAAPPTVTAAAYQLILDRRLGDYSVPAGWALFAAGNRQGDRGVIYTMPSPLANRFTHYEVEPHLDDWSAWAYAQCIDDRLIAFLRFRPDLLFDFDPAHTSGAFPSPRTWEYAHHALTKFADRPDLLLEALQSCVGAAAGVEAKAFLDHLGRLPDVDAILRGDSDEVPQEIGLQYGVATALVRRVLDRKHEKQSPELVGRVLDYAARLPQQELGVMLVTDLQRSLGRPLYDVPEFSRWANSVPGLLRHEMPS